MVWRGYQSGAVARSKWRRRRLGACQSRVGQAPGARLPWRLQAPAARGGGAGRAAGEEGVPGRRSRPRGKVGGLGRRWSRHPGRLSSGPGRAAPGCMPASAWRSRPESERRVLPQPRGSEAQPALGETTAESGCSSQPSLAQPPPAAAAERSASRGSFARGGGGGPGARARAGGEAGGARGEGGRGGAAVRTRIALPSAAAPSRISTG